MEDCIFCKIIKGEIPCTKLFENDQFIAFLDISPANKGHTLIVPKEHYETIEDLPDEIATGLMTVAKQLVPAIVKATECEGYNIQLNNKKPAGQLVPHAHLHIIPRFESDDFNLDWTHKEYSEGEMDEYKEKITKYLSS